MSIQSYSRSDILLVRYPFTDLSGIKVRPAIVVNAPHPSQDSFVVPLTSRLAALQPGEFVLADWKTAGLNVPSAVKRGIYTIHPSLVAKLVGRLSARDSQQLEKSLREWLGL
jgi:mRNA interferase MazF